MSGGQTERSRVDLRQAIKAVSDVVQNRPRPLREFDRIHMKIGDMLLQSEMVADWPTTSGSRLSAMPTQSAFVSPI